MKLLFFILCLMACIISGASQAAWELPRVGVEAKSQEIAQYHWVKQHTRKREPVYIYNDRDSIADREFAESVKRLDKRGEVYVGR